ncbi:MAG: precorrin-2 C(20)-methyltransferase [Firmicutes bacterium]|nr:precorrin-2 C(20)-methyltransferase [Bacillota bacterium]
MSGKFFGIGVGPGDPDLLTLKAAKIIKEADVIIAPRTQKKQESTALAIARPFIAKDAEILQLVFPMVNERQTLSDAWENNKNVVLEFLGADKKVAFLTLGDPMLYSTYIYIYRLLEHCGYPIETIPGVTSFCSIGSRLNFPLVEGNDIISIVPATNGEEKLDQVMAMSDNIVLMKVYKNYNQVVEKLRRHGLADNAVMVSNCGLEEEEIVYDLKNEANHKVNYLTTILARKQPAGK